MCTTNGSTASLFSTEALLLLPPEQTTQAIYHSYAEENEESELIKCNTSERERDKQRKILDERLRTTVNDIYIYIYIYISFRRAITSSFLYCLCNKRGQEPPPSHSRLSLFMDTKKHRITLRSYIKKEQTFSTNCTKLHKNKVQRCWYSTLGSIPCAAALTLPLFPSLFIATSTPFFFFRSLLLFRNLCSPFRPPRERMFTRHPLLGAVLCALVALCVLSSPAAGRPTLLAARRRPEALEARAAPDRSFEAFQRAFGKTYESEAAAAAARAHFAAHMGSLELLRSRNPLAHFEWQSWFDEAADAVRGRYLNGAPHFERALKLRHSGESTELFAPRSVYPPLESVPSKKDWREEGVVTPVKDQGRCGSCWAFSTIGGVEGQWALAGHPLQNFSEQMLVSCDKVDQGCNGGLMEYAFDWLLKMTNGYVATEKSYSYTSGTTEVNGACELRVREPEWMGYITGFQLLATNEGLIMAYLAEHGPVPIAVDATDFLTYRGGVLTNGTASQLNHGVLLVGYNDENDPPYWIIKNSWGTKWGENGFIRVQKGANTCLMAEHAVAAILDPKLPAPPKPPGAPATAAALCPGRPPLVVLGDLEAWEANTCLPAPFGERGSMEVQCGSSEMILRRYLTSTDCTGPMTFSTFTLDSCYPGLTGSEKYTCAKGTGDNKRLPFVLCFINCFLFLRSLFDVSRLPPPLPWNLANAPSFKQNGQKTTTIETSKKDFFIYKPQETLYLPLLTNNNSNNNKKEHDFQTESMAVDCTRLIASTSSFSPSLSLSCTFELYFWFLLPCLPVVHHTYPPPPRERMFTRHPLLGAVLCALVALCVLSSPAAGRPTLLAARRPPEAPEERAALDKSFKAFQRAFGKTYESEAAAAAARAHFAAHMGSLELLRSRNPLAHFEWQSWFDEAADAVRGRYLNGAPHFERALKLRHSGESTELFAPRSAYPPLESVPSKKDWREEGVVTPLLGLFHHWSDRGAVGARSGRPLTAFSEQMLVSCDTENHGCGGGTMGAAFHWLTSSYKGRTVTEASYPYTSLNQDAGTCQLGNQRFLAANEDLMKAFLAQHGPLGIAVDGTDLLSYAGGIVTEATSTELNHAMLLVGYDDESDPPYWIIKNSWGTKWGEEGYLLLKKGVNLCLVSDYVIAGVVSGEDPPHLLVRVNEGFILFFPSPIVWYRIRCPRHMVLSLSVYVLILLRVDRDNCGVIAEPVSGEPFLSLPLNKTTTTTKEHDFQTESMAVDCTRLIASTLRLSLILSIGTRHTCAVAAALLVEALQFRVILLERMFTRHPLLGAVLCALVALCVLSSPAAGRPTLLAARRPPEAPEERAALDKSFKAFQRAFGKTYESEAAAAAARAHFAAHMGSLELLRSRNPLAHFEWQSWFDEAADAVRGRYLNGAPHFERALKLRHSGESTELFAPRSAYPPLESVPSKKDWREEGVVTPVKEQGRCGSCWAFSTIGVIEGQWALAGHPLTAFSEQMLVSCDEYDYGCGGGAMETAFRWLFDNYNGYVATEASYPYNTKEAQEPETCQLGKRTVEWGGYASKFLFVADNEEMIMAYLAQHGPLGIAVDGTDLVFYAGGIVTEATSTELNHAMLLVGYDDESDPPYWIIKNSWGTKWGKEGYLLLKKGANLCLMNQYVIAGVINEDGDPPPTPVITTTTTSTTSTSTAPPAPFRDVIVRTACKDNRCSRACSEKEAWQANTCLPAPFGERGSIRFQCKATEMVRLRFPLSVDCTGEALVETTVCNNNQTSDCFINNNNNNNNKQQQ
eukprot:gene7859-5486_t